MLGGEGSGMAQAPPRSTRSENPPHPRAPVGNIMAASPVHVATYKQFHFGISLWWIAVTIVASAIVVLVISVLRRGGSSGHSGYR